MKIYEDFNIKIDLIDDSNILLFQVLDTYSFTTAEIESAFYVVMSWLKRHLSKKIIFSSTKSMIYQPDEDYKKIIETLLSGLHYLEIEKFARIYVDNSLREAECIYLFHQLIHDMRTGLKFRNFHDIETALEWLNS